MLHVFSDCYNFFNSFLNLVFFSYFDLFVCVCLSYVCLLLVVGGFLFCFLFFFG